MNYLRYVIIFAGVTFGLPILFSLVSALTGFDIPTGATGVIPAIAAASVSGQYFARENKREPSKDELAEFARKATLMGLAVHLLTIPVAALVSPAVRHMMSDTTGLALIVGILVLISAFNYLVNRHFAKVLAKAEIQTLRKKGTLTE